MSLTSLVGEIITIHYPSHNFWDVPLEFVPRYIEITKEPECLLGKPLMLQDILRRPRVRRGCTLLTGIDVDLRKYRRFYQEAACGGELPAWQICLYDPADPDTRPEPMGRVFAPTHRDWMQLVDVVHDLHAFPEDFDGFVPAAFPVV